jgi:DNA mismatch repair protein MutS
MSEIITLKNVLNEAQNDAKCFAVFDELFRGTNIEDALEISAATIKGLLHFPPFIIFYLHSSSPVERNGRD